MTPEEKRYRVTTEYKSLYQVVVEATSPEEAEYFAKAIDLDKWQHIETDFEIVDVSKDFFLKRVKDEQGYDMKSAIIDGFKRWNDYSGRSSRSQFWWFYLFVFIFFFLVSFFPHGNIFTDVEHLV